MPPKRRTEAITSFQNDPNTCVFLLSVRVRVCVCACLCVCGGLQHVHIHVHAPKVVAARFAYGTCNRLMLAALLVPPVECLRTSSSAGCTSCPLLLGPVSSVALAP